MAYDEFGNWVDDEEDFYAPSGGETHLSPWEQAHGGQPYDPGQEYKENAFDRVTRGYYDQPEDERDPNVNWYNESTWPPDGGITICFPAGTQIATPRGLRSIETIVVGDVVVATPHGDEATVSGLHCRPSPTILRLTLADGMDLCVTAEHPIWDVDAKAFRPAREMIGSSVLRADGTTVDVSAIAEEPHNDVVYNLTVDPHHTYFAGGVWVHNKSVVRPPEEPLPPPALPPVIRPPTRPPGPTGPTGPTGPRGIPGMTSYPIPGGKTFFSFPDFSPTPIDYPEFAPPAFGLGSFEAPPTTAGEWAPPSWDVGAPPTLTPYEPQEFVGPTAETFQTDPGYEFRAKEMERAIQNAASARGLLATGGTLQDLMTARGSLASQEYGNVWNRQFGAHNVNEQGRMAAHDRNEQAKLKQYEMTYGAESDEYRRAVNNYNTKRATDTDTYGRALTAYQTNYAGEQDKFTRALTSHLTGYGRKQDDWTRERDIYATNLGKEASSFGINVDKGRFDLQRDDSRWNQLLGLYNLATRTLPTYNPMPLPEF